MAQFSRFHAPLGAWRAVSRLCSLAFLVLSLDACLTMSPEQEKQIGRQSAAAVEKEMGLVDDRAMVDYVKQIGDRVAKNSARKDVTYRFHIADTPEPNAFALPGGYIYVSRGLLAIANSEDELAGVLGHEVGHVVARHSAERQSRALGVGILSTIGALAGAVYGGPQLGQIIGQASSVAGQGLIASYSRGQEREADDLGQRMASQSGYDPRGVSDFLRTLGRESKLAQKGRDQGPSFFDSHPATEERVQTTLATAKELGPQRGQAIVQSREAFVEKFEGLLVGPDPAKGVFVDENLFLQPGLDFGLSFPRGWQTVNQDAAVAAISPQKEALIVLEPGGEPGDPREAGLEYFEKAQLRAQETERLRINGMTAYRALAEVNGNQGPLVVQWIWISHPRGMYRLTSSVASSSYKRFGRLMDVSQRSFHRLTASERSRVTERRLQVVRARGGESLGALGDRAGNAWTVEETAVANGLTTDVRLNAGFPIKIAVEKPYTGR